MFVRRAAPAHRGPGAIAATVALAMLLPGLPAQERKPAFGVVVDEDGVAVAGASVTCVGTPWFGDAEGPTDVVELQSDARGRFLARLLPRRTYSVWAVTTPQGERFRCSQVQENVGAGAHLELVLGQPRTQQRVLLRGGDLHAALHPLRIEVLPDARGVHRVVLPAGTELVPPLPPLRRVLVLDRDGGVLWQEPVPVSSGPPPSVLRVALPPPRDVAVQVRDAKGRPIAGAVIDHCAGELRDEPADAWLPMPPLYCWRRVGVTTAEGAATLQLPAKLAAGGVLAGVHLRVRAAGCAEVHAGNVDWGCTFVGGKVTRTAVTPVLQFVLEPAIPVAIDDGPKLDDVLLCLVFASGNRIVGSHQRVADMGAAMLPAAAQLERGSVLVIAPGADAGPRYSLATHDGERHRIGLRSRQVVLQIGAAGGGPLQGGLAVALPFGQSPPFAPLLPVPLDQAGRGTIALGGGDWLLFASAGDGIAWRTLRDQDGDQQWRFELKPAPIGTARLFDDRGTPLVGAVVSNVRVNMRGDFDWRGEGGALATLLLRLQPHLLRGRRSDGTGRLHLPLFPLTCWTAGVKVTVAGVESEFFDLEPDSEAEVFLK